MEWVWILRISGRCINISIILQCSAAVVQMRTAWNKNFWFNTKDVRLYSFISEDGLLSDLGIILKSFSKSTISWGSIPPISAKSFWSAFFNGSLPLFDFAESSVSREREQEEDKGLAFVILFSRLKNTVIIESLCSVETFKESFTWPCVSIAQSVRAGNRPATWCFQAADNSN